MDVLDSLVIPELGSFGTGSYGFLLICFVSLIFALGLALGLFVGLNVSRTHSKIQNRKDRQLDSIASLNGAKTDLSDIDQSKVCICTIKSFNPSTRSFIFLSSLLFF